jgi:hypothetical protein
MIDVKAPLRTAYYSLLNGQLTFNASNVPVSESVEKLADTSDLYVLLTQQNGQSQNTQDSWDSEETMLVDIVARGTRVSKSTLDNIANQIFTLLFPSHHGRSLTGTGITVANLRVTDDRYLVFTTTGGKNVQRRLITFTQLVSQ